MTQPIFDPEHWHEFVKKLGGKPAIPILVGIWAVDELQAGAAAEQRSAGNNYSGTITEITRSGRPPQRENAAFRWQKKCWLGRGRNWQARI